MTLSQREAEWLKDDSREHFQAYVSLYFVSPGTFSPLKIIGIQTGPSEYQWPLLMQFNVSHFRCCPFSQNKNCFCPPRWKLSHCPHRIQSNYRAAFLLFTNRLKFKTQFEFQWALENSTFSPHLHIFRICKLWKKKTLSRPYLLVKHVTAKVGYIACGLPLKVQWTQKSDGIKSLQIEQ